MEDVLPCESRGNVRSSLFNETDRVKTGRDAPKLSGDTHFVIRQYGHVRMAFAGGTGPPTG